MRKKILMTICFLAAIGLSLGAGVQARAQERLYDVDLSMSGATVSSFTTALTGQTGVLFSYETDLASKPLGNISIKQNQASLESILTRAFSGKGIAWKVVNRTVVLTAEQSVADARKVVRGTVKDASGEPLIAAGVLVKDKSYGVTTDVAGNYSIEVAQGETLVFSFLGYETKEVKVGTSSTINVVLEDDSTLLDDEVHTTLQLDGSSQEPLSCRHDHSSTALLRALVDGLLDSLLILDCRRLRTGTILGDGVGFVSKLRFADTLFDLPVLLLVPTLA